MLCLTEYSQSWRDVIRVDISAPQKYGTAPSGVGLNDVMHQLKHHHNIFLISPTFELHPPKHDVGCVQIQRLGPPKVEFVGCLHYSAADTAYKCVLLFPQFEGLVQ